MILFKRYFIILLCFLCFNKGYGKVITKDTVTNKNLRIIREFNEKEFLLFLTWGIDNIEFQILDHYMKDSIQMNIKYDYKFITLIEHKDSVKRSLEQIIRAFEEYPIRVYKKEEGRKIIYILVINIVDDYFLDPKIELYIENDKIYKIQYH